MNMLRTTLACAILMSSLAAGMAAAENLYNENSYRSLASDKRAHLPGDVLTVLIMENSSATTTADTSLNRNNTVGVQASLNTRSQNAAVAVNNTFDGGGTVQRTG